MNVLELFCGTKSVGKVCESIGWNSVSVDMEKKFNPTHLCNIMDFDYKQYPKDYFDVIWASPPCTNYSHLQNCYLGRIRKGVIYTKEIQEQEMKDDDKLVLKTLEIINYFNPHYWFIENPATSRMKDRPFMKDINNYVVDYCMYSDWGYRKRTRIWTNRTDFIPKLCDGKGTCGNMVTIDTNGAKHSGYNKPIKSAKRTLHSNVIGDANKLKEIQKQNGECKIKGTTQQERYRVPSDLILSLFFD